MEGSEPGDVKESVGGKADVDTNPGALLRTGKEAKPGDFGKEKDLIGKSRQLEAQGRDV